MPIGLGRGTLWEDASSEAMIVSHTAVFVLSSVTGI